MVNEYVELARVQKEASEFLLGEKPGEKKAYGTINYDGNGTYHISMNITKPEWQNIADEVKLLLQRLKLPGEQGKVISIVRDHQAGITDSKTDERDIVRGLEQNASDPKGLPTQPEQWECKVDKTILDRVRKELTNRISR